MKFILSKREVSSWLRVCRLLKELGITNRTLFFKEKAYLPYLTEEILESLDHKESLIFRLRMILTTPGTDGQYWIDLTEEEAMMYKLSRP